MHYARFWRWLVSLGLYKDVLATVVALILARIAVWRPLRRHHSQQATMIDLLRGQQKGPDGEDSDPDVPDGSAPDGSAPDGTARKVVDRGSKGPVGSPIVKGPRVTK